MLKKVRDYMREHEMTAPGDAVIVALSGGADSVCLLTVLKQLATPEFLLRAVHVHHGIRGAEADRDEAFAQKLCESLSVPLCVAYCHVPAYAAEHGLSEEEAGRILRYQVLEKEAGKWEQELPAALSTQNWQTFLRLRFFCGAADLPDLPGSGRCRGAVFARCSAWGVRK